MLFTLVWGVGNCLENVHIVQLIMHHDYLVHLGLDNLNYFFLNSKISHLMHVFSSKWENIDFL